MAGRMIKADKDGKRRRLGLGSRVLITLLSCAACFVLANIRSWGSLELQEANNIDLYYQNGDSESGIEDMGVLQSDSGYYYVYSNSKDRMISCVRSANMVDWSEAIPAYDGTQNGWSKGEYASVDVVEHQNRYYLFYAADNEQGQSCIGVAEGSSEVQFTDTMSQPLVSLTGIQASQPDVLVMPDGSAYLYFIGVGPDEQAAVYGGRLNENMDGLEGEVMPLAVDIQVKEGHQQVLDAEVIVWDEKCYLLYTCKDPEKQSSAVFVSASDTPLGEYMQEEEHPLISPAGSIQGVGSLKLVTSPDASEYFLFYLRYMKKEDQNTYTNIGIDRILFDEQHGFYFNGPTTKKQLIPASSGSKITNLTAGGVISLRSGHDEDKSDAALSEAYILTDGKRYNGTVSTGITARIPVDESGCVNLVVKFTQSQVVTGIIIYGGDKEDFVKADLYVGQGYWAKDLTYAPDTEHSIFFDFKPFYAEEVLVTLYPAAGKDYVELSELVIIGDK